MVDTAQVEKKPTQRNLGRGSNRQNLNAQLPRLAARAPECSARADMQPGQTFLGEHMSRRLKSSGLIKCTDMEVGLGRQPNRFARQS
jgi:hypothetical protein